MIWETKATSACLQALDKPKETSQDAIPDHTVALSKVIDVLQGTFSNSVSSEMRAVGHRVVHGGPKFHKASVVNPQVLAAIKEVSSLAPLHNPPNLMGIEAASKVFSCPQVAVFDTAFHMTMPPSSFMYALPYEIYEVIPQLPTSQPTDRPNILPSFVIKRFFAAIAGTSPLTTQSSTRADGADASKQMAPPPAIQGRENPE